MHIRFSVIILIGIVVLVAGCAGQQKELNTEKPKLLKPHEINLPSLQGQTIIIYTKSKNILAMEVLDIDASSITGNVSVVDGRKAHLTMYVISRADIKKITKSRKFESPPNDPAIIDTIANVYYVFWVVVGSILSIGLYLGAF